MPSNTEQRVEVIEVEVVNTFKHFALSMMMPTFRQRCPRKGHIKIIFMGSRISI